MGTAARVKRAETEVGELRSQLSQLRAESAREIRAAEDRAAQAAAQAESVSEVYAAYQADKKSLGQAVELLQKERGVLQTKLQGAEERVQDVEAHAAASEVRCGQLEAALGHAQGEARLFAEQVAQLQGERDALDNTAAALRVELQSAKEAMAAHTSGRAAVEAQQAAERREKERVQQQLMELEATRADLKREIGAYHTQAEQLQQLLVAQAPPPLLLHPPTAPASPHRSRPTAPTSPHRSLQPHSASPHSHAATLTSRRDGVQDTEREGLQRECDRLTQLLQGERASMAAVRGEMSSLQQRLAEQEASGRGLQAAMASERG